MQRIPFNREEELKVIGEYKSIPRFRGTEAPPAPVGAAAPGALPGANPNHRTFGGNLPKLNTPISPEENIKLLFKHEKPLWTPSSYDNIMLVPRIIPDNRARALVMDLDPLKPEERGGLDWFGVQWDYVEAVGGSMVRPGEPKIPDINEWEKYIKFPNLDELDWEGSAARHAEYTNTDRLTVVWLMNGMFERLISFMDFENAALALIDEEQQEGVHRLFSALCDFYDEVIERFQKYYHMNALLMHDDWGSQRAPFFSLDTCREMLVPYIKRCVDSCHKRGIFYELHSCGKNELLVPAMIEAGVDVWSPQPMNDIGMLIKKYPEMNFGYSIPGINMDASDEELYAAIDKFINVDFKGYTNFIASAMTMNPKAREYLYEISRIAYNS